MATKKTAPKLERMNLGLCENHADNMFYGGLVPKGPRCYNRAFCVVVYTETINLWDGTPNTQETSKLCSVCLAHVNTYLKGVRRARRKSGYGDSKGWPRKLEVIQPGDVTKEHVVALCRGYKRLPQTLLEHFRVDPRGKDLP